MTEITSRHFDLHLNLNFGLTAMLPTPWRYMRGSAWLAALPCPGRGKGGVRYPFSNFEVRGRVVLRSFHPFTVSNGA